MEKMDQIELYFGTEVQKNGKKMPSIGIVRDLDEKNNPYQYRMFFLDPEFKYKLKDNSHLIVKGTKPILCGNTLYPEVMQPLLVISKDSQVCIYSEGLKTRKITERDIKRDEDGSYFVTPEQPRKEFLGFICQNFDELPFLNMEAINELTIKAESASNKKINLTIQKEDSNMQITINGIKEGIKMVSQIDNSDSGKINDILCDLMLNCNIDETFKRIGSFLKNTRYKRTAEQKTPMRGRR